MTEKLQKSATDWVYRGIWRILADWFCVPRLPPSLPSTSASPVESCKPSEGFLRYLKFQFCVALLAVDVAILAGWAAIAATIPWLGAVLLVPALFVAIVPDVFAYVAIHIRYDTTWYVMNERSLRIRRGVWTLHETTISFENVQNVSVRQGPLQRWFGISTIVVDTAGGGGGDIHGGSQAHRGLLEGISDAARLRDRILARVRNSQSAGLGDELAGEDDGAPVRFRREHLEKLKEIRDCVVALNQ